jgi:carbonic anhydrase/acetyltransferase-like protein (isoleucine patch superfamily)
MTELSKILGFLNPNGNNIRVATIIPLTQKVLNRNTSIESHIIAFPNIHPTDFIYDSFIGGDVILGEENGIENSILIANGQVIKFGRFNSLQNLEAHGSDLREVGVEWGDANFIAHRAIFHGCKGGSRNYFGVGSIIPDLAEIGDDNYFLHGTTVGAGVKLRSKSGYRGSYIESHDAGFYGPSPDVHRFENQRTGDTIGLQALFHDDSFTFMREEIVPRTRYLLAQKALQLGGYLDGHIGKRPANGVMIHHTLQTIEHYLGLAARISEVHDRQLAEDLTDIQQIYSFFLDGGPPIPVTQSEAASSANINRLNTYWLSRHERYSQLSSLVHSICKSMHGEQNGFDKGLTQIPAIPSKRFPDFRCPQRALVVNYDMPSIKFITLTARDLLACLDNIACAEEHIFSFFTGMACLGIATTVQGMRNRGKV